MAAIAFLPTHTLGGGHLNFHLPGAERGRARHPGRPPRAGHSVVVLLKIYAHCIDGQADAVNKRIADALGGDSDDGDESRSRARGRW